MGLFLANMWNELWPEAALKTLAAEFGRVRGNWLTGPLHAAKPQSGDTVVLALSTFTTAVKPVDLAAGTRLLVWILFPDQALGWDFDQGRYRMVLDASVNEAISTAATVAANSDHTRRLLHDAGVSMPLAVICPAIDATGFRSAADPVRQQRSRRRQPPHVFWGHMWRTQKDPLAALDVAEILLDTHPEVAISLGRADSWLDETHSPAWLRSCMAARVGDLVRRHPKRFQTLPHFRQLSAYASFLGTVDVSFSTSREESFGLAMLEHAAAGAAIVAPNAMAYPDIHSGARLSVRDPAAIAATILDLVGDPPALRRVQQEGARNAMRFDVEHGINHLCDALYELA